MSFIAIFPDLRSNLDPHIAFICHVSLDSSLSWQSSLVFLHLPRCKYFLKAQPSGFVECFVSDVFSWLESRYVYFGRNITAETMCHVILANPTIRDEPLLPWSSLFPGLLRLFSFPCRCFFVFFMGSSSPVYSRLFTLSTVLGSFMLVCILNLIFCNWSPPLHWRLSNSQLSSPWISPKLQTHTCQLDSYVRMSPQNPRLNTSSSSAPRLFSFLLWWMAEAKPLIHWGTQNFSNLTSRSSFLDSRFL